MSSDDTPDPGLTPSGTRAKSGAELRAHPRFRHVAGATCRWQDGNEHFALLVNVSAGGARLMVRLQDSPPPLAAIVLRAKSGKVLDVPAHAVYTERREGLWLLGCSFDRLLSVPEILEYGS
jgi:hypothetical protein